MVLCTGSASESAVADLLGVVTLDDARELESANGKALEPLPEPEPEPEVQPEVVGGGTAAPVDEGTGLNERLMPDARSLGAARTLQS